MSTLFVIFYLFKILILFTFLQLNYSELEKYDYFSWVLVPYHLQLNYSLFLLLHYLSRF
nr:MAG TPA: hypothetical protein [Caudoviricetes sp.]